MGDYTLAFSVNIEKLNLTYSGKDHHSLKEIDLFVPANFSCAILGDTGAGKTTLLNTIAGVTGLHHRSKCSAELFQIGSKSFNPIPTEILFPEVALVLQDPYIQLSGVRDTVEAEIAFTLDNLNTPEDVRKEFLADILKRFDLESLATRKPTQLSGGELQRLVLASVIIGHPKLLLLDEPTKSLDGRSIFALICLIRNLKQESTIIFTDTEIDFALQVADIFVVMFNGAILFKGNKEQFIRNLHHFSKLLPATQWIQLIEVLDSPNRIDIDRRLRKFFLT